jgi:hypothetical protein
LAALDNDDDDGGGRKSDGANDGANIPPPPIQLARVGLNSRVRMDRVVVAQTTTRTRRRPMRNCPRLSDWAPMRRAMTTITS